MNATYLIHLLIFGVLIISLAAYLPKFSLTRPVSYSVLLAAVFLAGLICLKSLPLELMPDISYGNVTIFIDVRGGMPPQDIERLITKPVEEAMSTVSNMKNIVSNSKKNRSITTIELEPGLDMDLATLEVREKFLKVKPKLPKEIEIPIIAHYEENDAPVVIAALMSSEKTPEELRTLIEQDIKEQLLKTNGVANVEIGGGRKRKILVEIDKNRLTALGLSFKKIISTLEKSNISMQVGSIEEKTLSYTIRTMGAFKTVEEIENIGIAIDSKSSLIRIKDFATVKDFYLEAESYSRLNSKAAVTMYIQKESLTNTVEVAKQVRSVLAGFDEKLDDDIQMLIISDQSEAILSSLKSVQMTIFYGAVLVILVLSLFLSHTKLTKYLVGILLAVLLINLIVFYFLGIPLDASRWIVLGVLTLLLFIGAFWRRDILLSFVVAFSIPVTLFITIIFMYLEHFSLNVISLSGLVLGIGLLVDNSIVVLENFDHLRKKMQELSFKEQIELAAEQMASPMVGGTLTTVVVFLPFFLLQKQAQLLYAGIAFTVITTLLASLFSALSLVPFLAAKLIHYDQLVSSYQKVDEFLLKLFTTLKKYFQQFLSLLNNKNVLLLICIFFIIIVLFKLQNSIDIAIYILCSLGVLIFGVYLFRDYKNKLIWVMKWRKLVLSGMLLLFIGSVLIFVFRLPKDFMASREENEFIVFVELSSGVKLDICNEIVKEVEIRIQQDPEIKDMIKSVSSRVEGWSSKVYVSLVPRQKRDLSTQQVIDYLRDKFSDIGKEYDTFVYFSEPQKGKEIILEIYGANYETLSKLAMEAASKMGQVEGFSDVKIRYRPGQPELTIRLDSNRVSIFGLDNKTISESLHAQIRGLRATSFYDKGEEIETIVRLNPEERKTLSQIKGLLFLSPKGFYTPVEHLSVFEYGKAPSEIWHRNKSRVIQVSAGIGSMSLTEAAEKVKVIFNQMSFPTEYYPAIGGNYDDLVASNRNFWMALSVTIFLIYAVMASLFESYTEPIIIMVTVALSVIGAVLGLVISQSVVTLGVSIGILMLSGIVVNNGIMLIDRINHLQEKDNSKKVMEIIVEASIDRKRPIFMTTFTTVLGLLPMALDSSESAVLWSPLAVTVIGGLITSTILTLFVLPCFYLFIRRWEIEYRR